MKRIAITALVTICLIAPGAFADDAPKADAITQALNGVPAPELPARAAELIHAAKSRQREAATVAVIKEAVGRNPAGAPAIVGSVAKVQPDMAPLAAATAALLQPEQASLIAKAAAAAAPSKAAKIVVAVMQSVPGAYRSVAVAVADVVPGASKDILKAVASVRSDLKHTIELALENYVQGLTTVGDVLDWAKAAAVQTPAVVSAGAPAAAPAARGPAVGPPYLPFSGSPSTITPATSGDQPSGGRNYAEP